MPSPLVADPGVKKRPTVKQRLQALIRRAYWKMDIHPTADISPTAYIDRTWPRGIHISKHVIVDDEAVVLTHDMTRGIYVDTWLEDNCYIGKRAVIMPGIRIGRGSTIAPGAVVVKDVPPNSDVIGNPAIVEAKPE